MTYTDTMSSYNERWYGKPWMAIITDSLTNNFSFLDCELLAFGWDYEFRFEADPGTLLAYGQKNIRKGRGRIGGAPLAADGYQICLPDGTDPIIPETLARKVHPMRLEDRWRHVAQVLLVWG